MAGALRRVAGARVEVRLSLAPANGLSERLPRGAAFLPKRFTLEALSQRVRSMLEG